jgi:rare lipoprotein A
MHNSSFLLIVLTLSGFAFQLSAQTPAKADTGIASFYSHKFHGRRTASGQIFHVDSLTAAHKRLPFGTVVRVTNIRNGRSVIVTVNDRGMKGKNRIIDLSPAAARKIGIIERGLAKVAVEVIKQQGVVP